MTWTRMTRSTGVFETAAANSPRPNERRSGDPDGIHGWSRAARLQTCTCESITMRDSSDPGLLAVVGGPLHDHAGPMAQVDQLVPLVVAPVLEPHDPGLRTALRLTLVEDRGFRAQGVTVEDRIGESHLLVAQVADGRPEGEIRDDHAA